MENIIDAVIVDTSALQAYQFDFAGWTSQILPSFFNILSERSIRLLNHYVLDCEIQKHISESEVIKKLVGLSQTFNRNKDFLKLINISADDAIEKLRSLDIENVVLQEYMKYYSCSYMLPFTDPERIFKAYFSSEPPFSSTGEKKSEFPDAFIIDAVKEQLLKNTGMNILVVSSDNDWKDALEQLERVVFCTSIDQAMQTIQDSDKILPLISDNMTRILSAIAQEAEKECFSNSEFSIVDEVEVDKVTTVQIDNIIPLKIADSTILFKCTALLHADGFVRVIDEERSYYDREDDRYLFVCYSDINFQNAEAKVECEIQIRSSFEDNNSDFLVESVKILTKYAIDLAIEDAVTSIDELSEEDLALEVLREDMGL